MNKIQTFEQFLATSSADISVVGFVVNLLIAGALAGLLGILYVRFGRSLSNREVFSKNFMILSMTIMVIITIVKSSLALSLGLVGALSIVRFRTAIKEPEELSYAFLAIAIGLGMGADQTLVTCISFFIIATLVILRSLLTKQSDTEFGNLRIYGPGNTVNVDKMTQLISQHSLSISLKRLDEEGDNIEVLYAVIFAGYDELAAAKKALKELSPNLNFSFFSNIINI